MKRVLLVSLICILAISLLAVAADNSQAIAGKTISKNKANISGSLSKTAKNVVNSPNSKSGITAPAPSKMAGSPITPGTITPAKDVKDIGAANKKEASKPKPHFAVNPEVLK